MTTEQQWQIEQLLDQLNASVEAGDFKTAASKARAFASRVERASKVNLKRYAVISGDQEFEFAYWADVLHKCRDLEFDVVVLQRRYNERGEVTDEVMIDAYQVREDAKERAL